MSRLPEWLLIALTLIVLSPWRAQAQEVIPPSFAPVQEGTKLDAQGFRRAFEAASDADDHVAIARLVKENPTQFVPLFEAYTRVWIERTGESGDREQRAMDRARVLAAAADEVLEVPGLLEVIEAIEGWSDDDREAWRRARGAVARGTQLQGSFRWQGALEPLGEACAVFEQLGDGVGLSDAMTVLGNCYHSLGQYEKAIEHHTRALVLDEQIGKPQDIARSLANLGNCYYSLGQYGNAIGKYTRALELFQKFGSPQEIAFALNNLGACLSYLGRYEEAIGFHARARSLLERIGNSLGIANSLNNLGFCYDHLGQYEEAILLYSRALDLREKVGNPQDIANSLNNLGNCYDAMGQYQKAIERYQNALELREQIGNPQDIAASLTGLGSCYYSVGQYERAIERYGRALELREKIGNLQDIAASRAGLGICYYCVCQYERAIEHHARALELNEKIGNPQDIAASLNNLGNCYISLGQYERAIEHHTHALELREKIGNPQDIARSLGNLGCCYESLGQHEKAIQNYTRVLEFQEKVGNPQDIAGALTNLGCCYDSLGQYERAIEHHTHALGLNEKIGNPQSIATSLTNLGFCYHAMGQREAALRSFEGCVAALAKVPRRSFGEEGRAAFMAGSSMVPRHVCGVVHDLATKDALVRGFPLVEAFSSRTLLENLEERAEAFLAGADPELSKERASLLNHMVELRVALGKEASKSGLDSRDAEHLRAELARSGSTFQDLERRLRARNPKFAELISPRPASLAEAQAVLAAGEAMLVFVLGTEQSYVWILTAKSASLVALPSDRVIRASFDSLTAALAPDEGGHFKFDASFVAPARALFNELLGPVADQIDAATDLIVVPTGFLGFLPFEVLLTQEADDKQKDLGKLPYLIREKTVRYAPSASFLTWCRRQAERREDRHWAKDLCLFGDAIYGEAHGAVRARTFPDLGSLPRLMGTRSEVMSIAETRIGKDENQLSEELAKLDRSGRIAGADFDLYLGTDANRDNLMGDLSGYRILHLAVHGHVDEQFTWYSGLVLSGASDAVRVLNLVDIAGLKLDAELVFLSACETARGKALGSDGIRSTMRSFLLAGAESVVATQWPVFDDAASVVAQDFYHRLLKGRAPTAALREAKMALLLQDRNLAEGKPAVAEAERGARPLGDGADQTTGLRRYAHPSFWAPFILWGK